VPLSDDDAHELLELLEAYVISKRFRDRSQFVEIVGNQHEWKTARELFLKGRSDAGRTRSAASWQWGSFQLRLGMGHHITPGSSGSYMNFNHFLEMEARLLRELRLHPRVQSLVLQMVVDRRGDIETVRSGKKRLQRGAVSRIPDPIIQELRATRRGDADHTLPLRKVVALTTLTADLSVMFTTRDWGVAGTLSAIAAVPPALFT
jgi:hypothetical protein